MTNMTKVVPWHIDLPQRPYYFDDFVAVNPYTKRTFGNLYYYDIEDINNPHFVYVGIYEHHNFIVDRS